MKFELREKDRRAILLLIAASALYGIVSFVALPAFDRLKDASTGVGDKEQQLKKYRRAVIRKGHYTDLLQQARKTVMEAESRLIPGDNPTLASVQLQTIVEDAAKKVGIDLPQRNVTPARKKDDAFNEITMSLVLEATPAQILGFLAEIRNAPKFVVVRNVQIAPAQVLMAPPPKGDFVKTVRANVTLAAPIPVPVRKKA